MSIPVMNVSRALASALLVVGLGMTGCGKDEPKPVTLAGTGDSTAVMASQTTTARAWNQLTAQLVKWPAPDQAARDAELRTSYRVLEPTAVIELWGAMAQKMREMEQAGYLACFKAMRDAPQSHLRCGFGGSTATPGSSNYIGGTSSSAAGKQFDPSIGGKSLSPMAACDSAGQINPNSELAADNPAAEREAQLRDAANATTRAWNEITAALRTARDRKDTEVKNFLRHADEVRATDRRQARADEDAAMAADAAATALDFASMRARQAAADSSINAEEHESNRKNLSTRTPQQAQPTPGNENPEIGEDGSRQGSGPSAADCKERQKVFARSLDGIKQYIARAQQQTQLKMCDETRKDGGASDPRCNLGGGSKLGQSNCPPERLNCGDKNAPRNNPKYGGNAPVPGKTAGGCDPNKSNECY